MRAKFKLLNTNDVDLSLTITMSAKRWAEVAKQINDEYPGWQLSALINQALRRVQTEIIEDAELTI